MADRGPPQAPPLTLLSIVIPARDEEGCIAATVEHLHLELRLSGVPHEIVVIDDGSTDGTWRILQDVGTTMPELRPFRNDGLAVSNAGGGHREGGRLPARSGGTPRQFRVPVGLRVASERNR
ncbi:MAG TPA: glycosyltransferase [Gemmatimonadales bacterium]|nr:glycosyltransferase [Gemmatimonadales bacterium]